MARKLTIVLEISGDDEVDFESVHVTLQEFCCDMINAWGREHLNVEIQSVDDSIVDSFKLAD